MYPEWTEYDLNSLRCTEMVSNVESASHSYDSWLNNRGHKNTEELQTKVTTASLDELKKSDTRSQNPIILLVGSWFRTPTTLATSPATSSIFSNLIDNERQGCDRNTNLPVKCATSTGITA